MKFSNWIYRLAIWRDSRGQDMVEYALLAGFIAVAAGAAFPPISGQISTIFSRLISVTDKAGS
jgi:pilus assembly protein Flp/PilA